MLRIEPAIVDLNLTAPDTRSPTRMMQYTEYGGEMSLYVELFDAETGKRLARAMDHKRDRRDDYLEWTTRVTNNAMARRMMRGWAETLRENLDAASVAKGA